jgi:hypothetical protein
MNSFLQHLIARSLADPESVRPRLPSRFEPPLDSMGLREPVLLTETAEETAAEPAAPVPPAQPSLNLLPARLTSSSEPQHSERISPPPFLPLPTPTPPPRRLEPPPESSGLPPAADSSVRPELISAPPPLAAPLAMQAEMPWLQPAIPPSEQGPARPLTIEPVVRLHPVEASTEHPAGQEVLPNTRPLVAQPLVQPVRPHTDGNGTSSTIQVTIGRVEVRAVFTQSAPQPPQPRSTPALSLDEYLKQRDGGGP